MNAIERLRQIKNDPTASDHVRNEAAALLAREEQRKEQSDHEQKLLQKLDKHAPPPAAASRQGTGLVMHYCDSATAARRAQELSTQVGRFRGADLQRVTADAAKLQQRAR